jgi:hypothetical protein
MVIAKTFKRIFINGEEITFKKKKSKFTIRILKKIWLILDSPCGKRLAPYMKEILPFLENKGEIILNEETRKNF